MALEPWHAWLVLLRPRRIATALAAAVLQGRVSRAPNLWQVELGVLRMWHRMLFRSETIGTCVGGRKRPGWRAALLQYRPLRFPFLVWERAIAPWDLSGLMSSPAVLRRHLLGAHHDRTAFVYDLQILALYEGELEGLRSDCARVAEGADRRSRWLQDLVVYEGYHRELLAGIDQILAGAEGLSEQDAEDADASFLAWLRWCARQPASPGQTWAALRAGRFHFPRGLELA